MAPSGAWSYRKRHLRPCARACRIFASVQSKALLKGGAFGVWQGAVVVWRRAVPVRQAPGAGVWPRTGAGVAHLTAAQLAMLLEGIDWRHPARTWRPELAG
jgi:hypothetical protein